MLPPNTRFETPIPGLGAGVANVDVGEEDEGEGDEGPASVGEEDDGAIEVGSGEVVWVKPEEVRSVGLSQFPAPPLPVWRYSGAGSEAEIARARSAVAGGRASGS